MTTKKQDLINNPKNYESESYILECFFSEKINKFCLQFNGKLITYSTWTGFVSKRKYFIDKYNLVESKN